LPFDGSEGQIIAGHLHEPPDLTMLPGSERPAVARALAKDPSHRWPTCQAFVEVLATVHSAAAGATEIHNCIGMRLVLIPAGSFLMGSPDSEAECWPDERPQHEVTITKPFYLGLYSVTQQQYEAVMGTNPAHFHATKGGGPDHPVEQVSWDDAIAFCANLSNLPAEKRQGRVYDLPTEAVAPACPSSWRQSTWAPATACQAPAELGGL
jgi:formylglycine-generating enzyme required for sulfatase activity